MTGLIHAVMILDKKRPRKVWVWVFLADKQKEIDECEVKQKFVCFM